jgi:hypothetical protein
MELEMVTNLIARGLLIAVILCTFAATLSAQGEANIYAGGIWPDNTTDIGDFVNTNIWGGRIGGFVTENFEIEGNFGFVNHFTLKNNPNPANAIFGISQPATRAYVYDVFFSWNFGEQQAFGARIAPFVTFGLGGLTAKVIDADAVLLRGGGLTFLPGTTIVVANPDSPVVLENGDTFFTFSYGGGLKALKIWGPVGLRADIRGRTAPNFFGHNLNWWPELTGAVTFSWGEP